MFGRGRDALTEATISSDERCLRLEIVPGNRGGVRRLLQVLRRLFQETLSGLGPTDG